uniref:Uncharacterized protein n=1 Tax=Rhizophora mucronata TaxID=61149 RepID=A0A2P2JR00_RHIMU
MNWLVQPPSPQTTKNNRRSWPWRTTEGQGALFLRF